MKKRCTQNHSYLSILFFVCLLCFVHILDAQNARPTVGLVLSGGGAKGMAHIGVIQALEDSGIPIDYIAGTSIGAIVGGLYAAGYSPQEMEAIFLSAQFPEWMKGAIDDKYTYYFKKQEPTPSWIDPILRITPLGVKLKIPTNVVSPLLIDFEFMNIYSGASALAKNNFDSLFVPFRCVASDLTNQRPYYFSSGDLGTAIRASMTFPFYFNPIIQDSIFFFDGGIYNNFPVRKMKEDFNPDVIIGSKVANNFPPPQEGDIASYLQKMIANVTEYELLGFKGIILEPKMSGGLNVIDFTETCEYSQAGYQIVIDKLDSIRELISYTVSKAEIAKRRREFQKRIPNVIIDSIEIKGVNKPQEQYIRKIISKKEHKYSNVEQIREYYFRLFSDYNIKYIHPNLVYDTIKRTYTLVLNAKIEDVIVPKIGGYVAAGTPSEAFLGIDYRQLRRVGMLAQANAYLGRYYNSATINTRFDFPTSTPFYTIVKYTYNLWNYSSSELFTSSIPPITRLKQNEQHFNFEIGMPTGVHSKVSITPSLNREEDSYKMTDFIGQKDKLDKSKFSFISTTFSIEKNTLNKPQYAWKGVMQRIQIAGVLGEEEHFPEGVSIPARRGVQTHRWLQAEYKLNKYFETGGRYFPGFSFEAFASTQQPFFTIASTLLHLPAFTPTIESTLKLMPEYRANYYLAPGIQNVYKLWDQIYLRAEAYLFVPLNIQLSFNSPFFTYEENKFVEAYRFVFSAGAVYHSPIGPVSLLVNYHNRNENVNPWSVVFNIGYVFFNKRGLER